MENMLRTRIRRFTVLAALAAASALVLTGCVDNSNPDAAPPVDNEFGVTVDETLAAEVPSDLAGTLVIGMDNTYPPNEFKDDAGNPTGWGVDLSNAIAIKLGLTPEIAVSKFDNIIPSVAGGKYNLGVSSFTDTLEREKQVDFVNYYVAGVLWASQAGATVDPNNACGLKVAVQATTYEDTEELPAKNAACADAGKPAIEVLRYDTQQDATNAVILGKADAFSADSPVTLFAISQSDGKLAPAGETFDVAPYGIVVAKDSPLVPLVQKAVQALIDDGSYMKILDKWGVADGAVMTAEVNAASKG